MLMVRCYNYCGGRKRTPGAERALGPLHRLYINTAEISRVISTPVYSFPKVTFTIALDQGGSLRALEEPTHTAAGKRQKKLL